MDTKFKNFKWKGNKTTHMHIELSNQCNAACPMCPRYVDHSAKVRPDLVLDQITIEKFRSWFPPEFLKTTERILFCGTHGDPMMAKDVLEITKYIIECQPKCALMFHTNGGVRNPEFWTELGNLIKRHSSSYVAFSVDGLEDTNHLYRRNVKWDKLIENIKAFNKTGARSIWEFLMFGYNEHQMHDAKRLSKELGFHKIEFKKALGFEKPGGGLKPISVYDKDGKLEYVINPPQDENKINTRNFTKEDFVPLKQIDFSRVSENRPGYNKSIEEKLINFDQANVPPWNRYVYEYETHDIECKSCTSKGTSEIYISANGMVFPCCFVGTRVDSSIDLYEDTQLRHAIRNYGSENFSLKNKNIIEILEEGHLDSVYTNSWSKEKFANGKLSYCAMTCGQDSQIDKIYEKNRFN